MASRPVTRLACSTAAGVLGFGLLAAAPIAPGASAPAAATATQIERNTNPTGTNAGSLPNRAGNLQLSLASTADGRIRVSWKRPGPARNFKRFVVVVGPSRPLDTRVRRYRVKPRRQSIVVDRAADAYTSSGNFTFVRVRAHRRNGSVGSSPGKWIQAPVTAPCTAAPQDRLTVGGFNLYTWTSDKKDDRRQKWAQRGPNAVAEILASGAHAVAIQEASGQQNRAYGGRTQVEWMLDHLNAADPDPQARWVDALTAQDYRPPRGRRPGHVGTRVFYDASVYRKLDSGLHRLVVPGWPKDSLIPWARLRAVSGDQAPFTLTSHHLVVGSGRTVHRTRVAQTTKTIAFIKSLRARFGDTVIVAGDLNSTANTKPRNHPQPAMVRAGMYDAFATTNLRGAAYPSTNAGHFPVSKTPLRRDYILTLGPVRGSCSYTNRVYQRRSQEASDHFMQVAVVPLPPA